MYAGLILVFLVALAATIVLRDNDSVQRIGPELVAELLGIIVTVAFVERLLARDEKGRKMRAAIGPLRKGRVALGSLLEGWGVLLKGVYEPRRTEFPRTVEQLFAPHYTEDLKFLDPRAGGSEGESAWIEAGMSHLLEGQRKLREIIATYGASLDPDYLEAIDELADDPFIPFLADLLTGRPTDREWRVAITQSPGYREGHFFRMTLALARHNELAQAASRFRSRSLAPSARWMSVRLSADHDLTIPDRIESSWWSEAPHVGELRSGVAASARHARS